MKTYRERNGVRVYARFKFEDAPTIPTTIHWKLDCETTGQSLSEFTEVPATLVYDDFGTLTAVKATIDVAASLNAIQDSCNKREMKTCLVVCNKDTSIESSKEYSYYVRNTRGRE